MNKCVLIPDSFKGTMSSTEICGIMKKKILEIFPSCTVADIPVADGGEGTVDCFLTAIGGEKAGLTVSNPFFEQIPSFYGLIHGGKTAVIEMAACAGLPLAEGRENPLETTTYGVGQMVVDALNRKCEKIIIGLGGSSTNDGGAGMAAAVGVRFYDENDREFVPVGGTLDRVARIDCSAAHPGLKHAEIIAMCDVDNPLCGENGASAVFGPQKGADSQTVRRLDGNLEHFSKIIGRDLQTEIAGLPGSGAAGGLGAGVVAFLGGALQKGIDVVLDTVNFESILSGADFVFTGEGKIDSQSLRGKVVVGVARRAKKLGVPVVAVVGDVGNGLAGIYEEGISSIVSINCVAVPFELARKRAKEDMAFTFENTLRLLKAGEACGRR